MKNFGSILIFISLIINSTAFGKILVVELKDENKEAFHFHGTHVKWVACEDAGNEDCQLVHTEKFSDETFLKQVEEALPTTTTMNFSFSLHQPEYIAPPQHMSSTESSEKAKAAYDKAKEEIAKDTASLQKMMENNPDVLFVIASGNGIPVLVFMSSGVGIKDNTNIYPQKVVLKNVMKVAAIDLPEEKINQPELLETAVLKEYANYGLTSVELAAPVGKDKDGTFREGTSFAAPYVAKIAESVREQTGLAPEQIKQLLMKSCYVKNIDQAIAATEDLELNGKDSIVYKAMFNPVKKEREAFAKQVGNILFVKSGGTVLPELVQNCVDNVVKLKMPIDQACLLAHQNVLGADQNQQEKLKRLWSVRKI